MNDEFRILLLVKLVAYIHEYKFLNQKYQDEKIRVLKLCFYEKYDGYKLIYNKNEMPLYVSIYVTSANKGDNFSSFFGIQKNNFKY